jgi:hypothetical protein
MGLNNVSADSGKQAILDRYKQFGNRMVDRIHRDVSELAKQKQQSFKRTREQAFGQQV